MEENSLKIKHIYAKAFFSAFFIFVLASVMQLIMTKGVYISDGDYAIQNVPFIYSLKRIWQGGFAQLDWTSGLGMDSVGTYSFYGLFSPVKMLALLLPYSLLKYAILPINAICYGLASAGACLYSKRYLKKTAPLLFVEFCMHFWE